MAARGGAGIEGFTDGSNHGGALFTRTGFRSQAPTQHNPRDITLEQRHVVPQWRSYVCVLNRLRERSGGGQPVLEVSGGFRVPTTGAKLSRSSPERRVNNCSCLASDSVQSMLGLV